MVEGWHHPTQTAAGAPTRFNPSEDANLPGKSEIENSFYLPTPGWAMPGGDVFEDEKRVVVLREVPADVPFKLVFISSFSAVRAARFISHHVGDWIHSPASKLLGNDCNILFVNSRIRNSAWLAVNGNGARSRMTAESSARDYPG
ncbi:hypothetical protein [Cupriavidus sp. D39]|uniref:hypothetical protein n=1 Tax=Cupriavidus sp. D39 TaxID=2997877 RepID=UPI00226F8A64|nr:hypothetical protein [Cupriavidus sp. D39]MCY0853822.1 hypothetical protein [Cupriavidus sp. D39]